LKYWQFLLLLLSLILSWMTAPSRISEVNFHSRKEITFALESRDIALNSVFGRAKKTSGKQDQKNDLFLANLSSIGFRNKTKKSLENLKSNPIGKLRKLIFSSRARGPPNFHVLI
jgi:hypothetical protein